MKNKSARNLRTQIVNELGFKIIKGDLAAGTILTSGSLERKYLVSRTVIREALPELHIRGITKAKTKTGTMVLDRFNWNMLDLDVLNWLKVSGISNELIEEFEELRFTYEPGVARIAAKRRTATDIATLKSALKKMTDAFHQYGPTSELIGRADMEFHEAIQSATQNNLIKKMGKLILPLLEVRGNLVEHVIKEADFIVQHRAILDAVIDENPDAAELAMKVLLAAASRASAKISKKELT